MKVFVFAARNRKEFLRDPLNLGFGLGFPLVVLLLLSAIQANIPVPIFEPDYLTPGIAVFGLSFFSLFSGMVIAKDRGSSFLLRMFASPMKARDFILGYTLPMFPMAIAQITICFIAAAFLGLKANLVNVLITLATLIPCIVFYIGIGLLAGAILNEKQVGGIIGALLTNLSAWLSGAWFSLDLVGGAFKRIAYLLPFAPAVDVGRAALAGNYSAIFPMLWWVIGYAIVIFTLAVLVFRRKMYSDLI